MNINRFTCSDLSLVTVCMVYSFVNLLTNVRVSIIAIHVSVVPELIRDTIITQ